MGLNGYVVLDAFFSLFGLGAAVITLVLLASTRLRLRGASPEGSIRMEDHVYLAIQLTYVMLGLTLASWISLYLLLDELVPLWPGAMCIYGVTRIGEGSPGVTGWLPTLVAVAQGAKPLVAFAAGAALVLYRLYRRAGVSELLPRVLGALFLVALLTTAATATELIYLCAPKRDVPMASGCCSVAAADSNASAPAATHEAWIAPAYYACDLLMVFMLWPRARQSSPAISDRRLAAIGTLAVVTLAIAARFVVDVAAPTLLHLPYHHCVYDLVSDVPESGVALGLLLWGTFCAGWACVVGWLGRAASTSGILAAELSHWQSWAAVAYLAAAAMFSMELWLA